MVAERPTWDSWGVLLAEAVAKRASCNRRQVGAVIMRDYNHSVVAVGYNGTEAGEVNCGEGGCPRGQLSYDECPALGSYSNCKGLHAEVNAIDFGIITQPWGMSDCTIYVTREPCEACYAYIEEEGEIFRIVYRGEDGSIVHK